MRETSDACIAFNMFLRNGLIWSYLSCHLCSQYLRCPTHEQFDPTKPTQFDLRSDGTWRTSHNDCDRSTPKYMYAIANSKFESSDRRMRSKSMGTRDGRT